MTTTSEQTASKLLPLVELPNIGGIYYFAGKLVLAAETYLASLFPISGKARLLELTTVLEILAPTPKIGRAPRDTLAPALAEAKRSRAALPADHPELRDVDRLLSRLGKLKTESIKESLRIWARGVSTRMPGWDPDQAAVEIDRHYDVRSKLIHDGTAPPSEIEAALTWLSEFVPAVLALLIREAADVGRTTTIAEREVPFQQGEPSTVLFSGGRGGESEAGLWVFWTVFADRGRKCTTRCRSGDEPGERFRRTEHRKGEEGCWQTASSASEIGPATEDEIIDWLQKHPDDWPFAERCQVGSKSWNIVRTDQDFAFEPV